MVDPPPPPPDWPTDATDNWWEDDYSLWVEDKTPYPFNQFTVLEVAQGAQDRMNKPYHVDQGTTSLCGPAAIEHIFAKDFPDYFYSYILNMQLLGRATNDHTNIEIKPHGTYLQGISKTDANYPLQSPPSTAPMEAVDYLFLTN